MNICKMKNSIKRSKMTKEQFIISNVLNTKQRQTWINEALLTCVFVGNYNPGK